MVRPVNVPPDEELLAAIRAGEMAAFDQLYGRYERRLYGYIRRMVSEPSRAEDLLQDVFMKVLADRTFDPDRGRFSAWLFKVARNECLMAIRGAKRRDAVYEAVPEPVPPRQPDEVLDPSLRVEHALAGLTEPQRQLLLLKQVGQLTYREIASIVGVAEGTVKSRLHEATKQFRQTLLENEG